MTQTGKGRHGEWAQSIGKEEKKKRVTRGGGTSSEAIKYPLLPIASEGKKKIEGRPGSVNVIKKTVKNGAATRVPSTK